MNNFKENKYVCEHGVDNMYFCAYYCTHKEYNPLDYDPRYDPNDYAPED